MGQTVATMYRRLLGREAGKSLLNDQGSDDESLGLFDRLWRMVQRLTRFLNMLLPGVAEIPPPSDYQIPIYPNPDHNHFIDIGIDDLAFHSRIPEITVTLVETDDELPPVEQRPSEIEDHVLESLICNVAITKAETTECGVSFATDNLSPAEERPVYRRLGPYSSDQKILLVGEGDFSFSASLAVAFDDASNMIATSLDSFDFLIKHYKRAVYNIMQLTSRGCMVMHGVDATQMANYPHLLSLDFDCIIYNFPHAGFADRHCPRHVQISSHCALVGGFMANAKKMIRGDGQIHITHKCMGFFLEWNLEELGLTQGLRLVEELPFDPRDHPGYSTKFGYGGDAEFDCRPCNRYKFQLVNTSKKKKRRKQKKMK